MYVYIYTYTYTQKLRGPPRLHEERLSVVSIHRYIHINAHRRSEDPLGLHSLGVVYIYTCIHIHTHRRHRTSDRLHEERLGIVLDERGEVLEELSRVSAVDVAVVRRQRHRHHLQGEVYKTI